MIGPEINAPDLTEAVIGYRRFHLETRSQHNYHLVSPHSQEPWPTVERTARCNKTIKSEAVVLDGIRPKQHSAPQKDCGCGIYAYFDPCPVDESSDHYRYMMSYGGGRPATEVEALVTLSGRIEVHAHGMRSQRARICALGAHKRLNEFQRVGLVAIAESFGVPVVDQQDLPRLAGEYGSPVPDSLRPGAKKKSEPDPDPEPDAIQLPPLPRKLAAIYARPRFMPPRWAIGVNAGAVLVNSGVAVAFHSLYVLPAVVLSTGYAAWLAGRRKEMAA